MRYMIVETDNYGGDYPDEKRVNLPLLSESSADIICDEINAACSGPAARRYWKVVPEDYILQPGFEP